MFRSWNWRRQVLATGFLIICTIKTAYSIGATFQKPPKPKIQVETTMFMKGDTFSLNCSVTYQSTSAMLLTWETPGGNLSLMEGRILNVTNEHEVTEGLLYNNITITNATEKDAGKYICICKNTYASSQDAVKMRFKERAFVELQQYINNPVVTNLSYYTFLGGISSYPRATVQVWKNGICCLPNDTSKYNLMDQVEDLKFRIYDLNISDTANYTFVATNKFETKNITLDLRVRAAPSVEIVSAAEKKFLLNTTASLLCKATGYPLPEITWIFHDQSGVDRPYYGAENRPDSLTQVTSELKVPAFNSGNITCHAQNKEGNASSVRNFIVYEVPYGFGLKNGDNRWYPEGEDVEIDCYASKADFTNVTWIRDGIDLPLESVKMLSSPLSYIARLWIANISLEDEANYTCQGSKDDYTEDETTIFIAVGAKRRLEFTEPLVDSEIEAAQFQIIKLKCQAAAVPPPQITWHKDNEPLENCTDTEIYTEYINDISTIVNTSVTIKMSLKYAGKYECIATSGDISEKRAYSVVMNESIPFKSKYLTIPVVIVLMLILLVVYLAWKIRKEKRFRKELAAAGLLNFKEGVPKSLNPDLGIDEQAELLPYDEKFEFPPDKLIIGKQLGAGAFGVVYKAEARGIINAEEVTPVAVKMVKKTADNMHIKALASELKIMVHLGKHVNIVNLLGACTKNAGKRELIVIVEYCRFGNIHNYMQRHRHVFIDQLTDNKDKNMGKVNKAFSSSSASTGMQSDYFGSNHTQNTDHTFVNTANSNRSGRKETGYVQPEWRTNYESDYSFDGRSPRPLTSRDLLAWAFQIARGMEYLASRKVLHGDLAARNVLLADDNVVKICDFGLARSMYKNDEYRKQENSPLPIKWLAIECMTDRIFSTQSDVWSFGVVLWELFSLAKTPYPNVNPSNFLQHLNDGHRLERPQYADDQLYDIMCRCWDKKPTARPNFTQLQEILGTFLEANVRNHYVDLNSMYNDMNQKQEGQEDYLARVCAPDYNNLVTPSPHHYVNDAQSFFPPLNEIPHDGDGYLQMTPATRQSIFSPRATGNKFDFDPRKMDVRMTEPNCQGSELTPMLTLNNLPAKSSESDHEGSSLPYINTYPPLDEEADDVFEMEQYNLKNEQLTKNSQNSAVTNPTYISFDVDKKPQNFSNNYTNSNVPNGLVK